MNHARIASPTTPRNRDQSIDLNTFDPRLLPDPAIQAATDAAARRTVLAFGGFDLLEMLGLAPATEAEMSA